MTPFKKDHNKTVAINQSREKLFFVFWTIVNDGIMAKAAWARTEFFLGFFETFGDVNGFVVKDLKIVVDLCVTCLTGSASIILNPFVKFRYRTIATVAQNRSLIPYDWSRVNSIVIVWTCNNMPEKLSKLNYIMERNKNFKGFESFHTSCDFHIKLYSIGQYKEVKIIKRQIKLEVQTNCIECVPGLPLKCLLSPVKLSLIVTEIFKVLKVR
jgi:hypothetical protein